jgi:DNA-directed RNA polymerase specialized sigma24 family protein
MSEENSVILIQQFRNGDETAAAHLLERYFARVDRLAQKKLSPQMLQRVGADDVAQSVYRSFFQKVADGKFLIEEQGKMWNLLAKMTSRKVLQHVEFHKAQKRDVSREQSMESGDRNEDGPTFDLADLDTADPQIAVIVDDALDYVLSKITPKWKAIVEQSHIQQDVMSIAIESGASVSDVRRVLTLRIKSTQGLGNAEIAEILGCAEVTIAQLWNGLLNRTEQLLAEGHSTG